MEFSHVPVLLHEAVDMLVTDPEGIYVDGTVGGGGHAYEICKRLEGRGRLIGIDRDADAVGAAEKRLASFRDRTAIYQTNFSEMPFLLDELGLGQVDGILLDLGVSSFQLDEPSRGFSYREGNSPLDMRMDQGQELTARDILATYSESELYRVIRDYGEDPFAKNIAKHIVRARQDKPIETAEDLNSIIRGAIPARVRATGGHPSKRTFQALRIECNRETEVLTESLDGMIDRLNPGGRLCVITFHSIEDRIVKENFKRNENPCTCPPDLPVCVCGKVSKGKVLTKKPLVPSEEERESNPRSKSAKLRVFEKKAGKD